MRMDLFSLTSLDLHIEKVLVLNPAQSDFENIHIHTNSSKFFCTAVSKICLY